MDRDADSAALCCRRALASDCCVWLSCCVACCSDWLSCWLDWLTCWLAWLTERDCWLSCCSWSLSAWICPWSCRPSSDGPGVIMARHPSRTAWAGSAAAGDRGCESASSSANGVLLHNNGPLPPGPLPTMTTSLSLAGTGAGPDADPFPTQAQLEHIKKRSARRGNINGLLAMVKAIIRHTSN